MNIWAMTTLKTHLKDTGTKLRDFAKRVGYSAGYISDLANGKKPPSFKAARKIQQETGGAVTLSDWPDFDTDQS